MANIKSVWDVNKGDKESDKKNEFFGSGGGQSGTGVLRPVKGQQGQGQPDQNQIDALRALQQQQQAAGITADGTLDDAITIYKNGFRIGNSEFRPSSDPQNQEFINQLLQQNLPKELEPILMEKLGPNARNLGVRVVNKTTEEYVPEEPKFQAFKGQGHSLGGGSEEKLNESFETADAKEIEVNPNGATAKIQVVLFNGKRVTVTVNLNNTILELYAHVKAISQIEANFDLLAGFPPKPLSDPKATIESEGLKGSRVQQKQRK